MFEPYSSQTPMFLILIGNIALKVSDNLFKELFNNFQNERSHETFVSTSMFLPQPHNQIQFSFQDIQILHKLFWVERGLYSALQKETGLKNKHE